MVMTHHSYGDRMWQMLCKALLDGELSDSVIAVKMNIHDGRDIHNVKINVATADFLKEDEVYTADKAIVDLVKDSNMSMQNLKYKVGIDERLILCATLDGHFF
jgi:predicted DNA-binding ArsR family transcriptional regulator